nr:MAG TPA: hypothetical protein [Caudoviricetes sp.]DAT06423.1 MAG TPA: hypothetical protein [Caudoviricetes sp.]
MFFLKKMASQNCLRGVLCSYSCSFMRRFVNLVVA